jgi:DNA-binding NarL/FixJ family response regulator
MTEPARIRVVLADDHAVVRLGLRTLLGGAPDIQVVGEAADGAEALVLCRELEPDVVVMDLSMSGMDGATATRALVAAGARTRVLVLTMHDEEEYLIPLLDAGAAGYVVKSAVSTELLDAIRTVATGRTFVRPEAARVLADGWTRRTATDEARQRHEQLSDRERTVFTLIAQGYSTSQIGERINVSAKTVDTYRRRINEKLGLTERAEYVRLALRLGVLAPDDEEASGRR